MHIPSSIGSIDCTDSSPQHLINNRPTLAELERFVARNRHTTRMQKFVAYSWDSVSHIIVSETFEGYNAGSKLFDASIRQLIICVQTTS